MQQLDEHPDVQKVYHNLDLCVCYTEVEKLPIVSLFYLLPAKTYSRGLIQQNMEPQGDVTSSSSSAFSALSNIVEREVAIVNSPKEESVEHQVELTEQDEKMTNLVLSLSRSIVRVIFYC